MSHIVQVKVKVRDLSALQAACRRVGIADPVHGSHDVFGVKAVGHAVRLEGWNYPVVFALATGEGRYDNYKGAWGKQAKLDSLIQAYGVELSKIQLRRKGFTPVETTRADGSIVLTVSA
jgi:hypothetical protein